MNTRTITMGLAALALGALGAADPAAGQAAPARHGLPSVLSHAALAKRQQETGRDLAAGREITLSEVGRVEPEAPEAGDAPGRPDTESLIARSSILSNAGRWTIVPRGSVLHVPPLFAKRINSEAKGKLVNWREFFGVNRGWIRPQEVSIWQARGDVPIDEKTLKAVQGATQVVIAVCQGGPISVLPPKEAVADALAGEGDAASDSPRQLLRFR